MRRQDAIKKASKFLGRKNDIKTSSTAKKIKEKAKGNPDLNRASLNQIIADIYQRGADPKDLDLQRIDFSTSYSNIRGQVEDLIKKRQGRSGKFENEKEAERKTGMDKQRKHEQGINQDIAQVRHNRRDPFNQFVDETKQAEKTFPHATDKALKKWKNNPNKYDIQGVDSKKSKEERTQAQLPFRRKSRIKKMKSEIKAKDGSLGGFEEPGPDPRFERRSRIEALKDKKVMKFEEDRNKNTLVNKGREAIRSDRNLDLKGSKLAENKDSRSMADVTKNIRGTTSGRSKQKGLREMGVASKKSEKTLDNFSKSVSDSGKQVSGKFDGNYF